MLALRQDRFNVSL